MTSKLNEKSELVKEAAPTREPIGEAARAWLHLANLQFSSRLTSALLLHFHNDPNRIFSALDTELDDVPGLQGRHLVRIRDQTLLETDRQLSWFERHDVWIVQRSQPEYPPDLSEIPDPPPFLFVRGTLTASDQVCVGIVGSRHATPYGRSVSERIAGDLAAQGLTIVSGGAVGIDAAAHRGALKAGGRTIAVLGCGLDVDYPRENRLTFEEITSNGAVISEYPLGAQPEAFRFPLRNRIISGISLGVLVVEAPIKSGALITARFAAEHGKPVMVVPGNIDRPTSAGSNELLRDGAVPVLGPEDVQLALNLITLRGPQHPQRSLDLTPEDDPRRSVPRTASSHISSSYTTIDRSISVSRHGSAMRSLPDHQQKLLDCLTQTPQHIDSISNKSGLNVVQAGVELTLLELEGFVRRLPGNTYISSQ